MDTRGRTRREQRAVETPAGAPLLVGARVIPAYGLLPWRPERLRPLLEQKAGWYAVLTDPQMPVTSTLWD